jgi:hypothetical protein
VPPGCTLPPLNVCGSCRADQPVDLSVQLLNTLLKIAEKDAISHAIRHDAALHHLEID